MSEGAIERTKLHQAPLKRVICQLRYPTVLGFEAAAVRSFQQALEDDYPTVEVQKIVVGVTVIRADAGPTEVDFKDVYRFTVAEGHTTVAISEDSLSLETSAYDRFSDFASRWGHIVNYAVSHLKLRRQARLGLRYSNVVERDAFEHTEEWIGLIANHLVQPVVATCAPVEATAFADLRVIRARTTSGGFTIRHGFPTPPEENLPSGYFIDIDNYDDAPKLINVQDHLDLLELWDHQSYALLRASVTDELWASFDPEDAQ